MSKRSKEEREAARQAARQAARLLRKERLLSIRQLDKAGARHIADHEQLSRSQTSMLARFARADVPHRVWRRLERCKPGRCAKDICSAACWFGDRGQINALMLEAADLLRGCGMPLRFVTIIDPHHFTAVGDLKQISTIALMQSLRRRFREAGDLFKGDRAFGAIEIAIEGDETGREWWSPHLHLVLATSAADADIRDVLRPRRALPDPTLWGRERWKPVVVKDVTHLANLLAYCTKREVERTARGSDETGRRVALRQRVPAAHRVEHDLWLHEQRPADRIFLRGMKRVHGHLRILERQ